MKRSSRDDITSKKEVQQPPPKKIRVASASIEEDPQNEELDEQERQLLVDVLLKKVDIHTLRTLYESVEDETPLSPDILMGQSVNITEDSIIASHNAEQYLDVKTREFLNSWLIKFYPDELNKSCIEIKVSSNRVINSDDFEKAKRHIEETDHSSSFSFISKISKCKGISERTIHSYTVGLLVVRAFEHVIPHVFIVDCDQKYNCPTIALHLNDKRAQVVTDAKRFLRADITLELSEDTFSLVSQQSASPIYVLTVEVQRNAMGNNVFAHKHFLKVCFEMRCMLKHIIERLSLSKDAAKELELFGILADSDGLCILSISTEIISQDQENAVHYRLQHSKIYKYDKPDDMKECLLFLWEVGYRAFSFWSQYEPATGEDKFQWMNSAKAKRISTTAIQRTYPNLNSSTDFIKGRMNFRIASVTRSEMLNCLNRTALFADVHNDDVKPLSDYLSHELPMRIPDIHTELLHLFLLCNHIVALVQSPEGAFYALGDESCSKSIVIWREDDQEMCVTATHKACVPPHTLQFNLPDDQSDNNYYYCSIQRIERELNLVKVSVLEKSDRTYAFMVMRPEGPAFAKISLGQPSEKAVMTRIKALNHVNISKVYSHFAINSFPDWMKSMVETSKVSPHCYVTITEPLLAYSDYFGHSFHSLSVAQQKQVICHTLKGILHGLEQIHSVGVFHHDLSMSNVMFRATATLTGIRGNFELCDPVLIDFNYGNTFKVGDIVPGWISYGTKPFAARRTDKIIGPMNDLFSAGVVFAHYARLTITRTEWFMPLPDEHHYMDYIDEIGRFFSGDPIAKYFGSGFASLFARLVSGLVAKMDERLSLRESLAIVNKMIQA